MKIEFKMKNMNDPRLVNALFILSEARLGKKYNKLLAIVIIPDPSIRNGDFPCISGYHTNPVNSQRWMKNRHNNKNGLKQYDVCPQYNLLLDEEDLEKVRKLENELNEKYPMPLDPLNPLTEIEMEKRSDFLREFKYKPVNQLTNKLLEQEAE